VARSLRLRALVLSGMNQPEAALRTSEQALSFMQEGDDPLLTARIQVEQARLEIVLHHAAAAIRALEAARTAALGSPDLRLRSLYYEQDAATLAALGRFREAYGELEHHHDAEAHLTAQLVAHQLSAQRGRLESQRLAHENALLRSEADTSARALVQAQRAAQLKSIALVMGALTIALALVGYLRQRTLMQRIKRLAQTDALTGTLSRGHLLELGQRILERSRRDHRSCALLMLDVDRFKEINDVHGHAAGDRALTSVARALQSSLRPGDQIGRYGGEEFAILLPGADEREAGVIAERLRQAVMALTPDWARGAKALTISGGIALAADVDEDFHQLLDRADRALYRAKDAGRNRMEYHGPEDRTRPLDTAMAAAAASFSAA
jgi:diguanylate cyclase (GGDEF)-like protein